MTYSEVWKSYESMFCLIITVLFTNKQDPSGQKYFLKSKTNSSDAGLKNIQHQLLHDDNGHSITDVFALIDW